MAQTAWYSDGSTVYVFTSPCCGTREVYPAWVVTAHRHGPLRLQCGRTSTDRLRPAGAGGAGCGGWFEPEMADA